jgi:DNA-binding response OmpR family regulator
LRWLDAEACHFVVLDLNLPGLDGIGTCRASRAGSEVPVVVVSIRDSERDKAAAQEAGADDYLTKPYDFEELLRRIRAVRHREPGFPF